jgi:2,4-dienoyl-CoA reductase-like NADH-dependent reductase (Old Yellow Enzyme family)
LRRIVEGIRAACAHNFVIGIKLNAADYVNASEDETRALDHLREIAGWRMVDFLEISGGDYEDPGHPSFVHMSLKMVD